PIPILHIHGTSDATISYDGNNPNGSLYTILGDSVPGLLDFWVNNNQCDPNPSYNANYAMVSGHSVEYYKWDNGLDSTVVEHLKINGADHEWFAPFYPREIWNFFKQHKNKDIEIPSAIRTISELSDLILYPNPAENILHLSSASKLAAVRIFNSQGQEILRTENTNSINIEHLHAGIYFVIVEAENSINKLSFIKK
ncbi:MAG: T9SS type A sorting domain-containing protein, partial [Bacteroidetes bacterium]|nr:T9SS type A sorting domain-containing protein [Bacteroidota bacterium]